MYIEYKCLYIYVHIYIYIYIYKVNNDNEEKSANTCVRILIVKDVIVHKFS